MQFLDRDGYDHRSARAQIPVQCTRDSGEFELGAANTTLDCETPFWSQRAKPNAVNPRVVGENRARLRQPIESKSDARTRTHSQSLRKIERRPCAVSHEVLSECDVSSHRFPEIVRSGAYRHWLLTTLVVYFSTWRCAFTFSICAACSFTVVVSIAISSFNSSTVLCSFRNSFNNIAFTIS